jgi:hypothetical protein
MKDMKMTPAETKTSMPAEAKMPSQDYPYGLRITLNQDVLSKLGIELPAVGEKVKGCFVAEVRSCYASESESGKQASCELQITEMEIDAESDVSDIAKRLYAEKE